MQQTSTWESLLWTSDVGPQVYVWQALWRAPHPLSVPYLLRRPHSGGSLTPSEGLVLMSLISETHHPWQ